MNASILIASPQMKDPFFERAVVLLWHHDEDGAIGVIINRSLEHSLADILTVAEDVDLTPYRDNLVGWGGPVETSSGTVLTRGEIAEEEGWVLDGVSVTRSQDALVRLLKEGAELLLCLGYAGWGPGQLSREIEDGGWLWTDVRPEFVFETPTDQRYDKALATLGLTADSVWMKPIEE